jgi:hypothetical protein
VKLDEVLAPLQAVAWSDSIAVLQGAQKAWQRELERASRDGGGAPLGWLAAPAQATPVPGGAAMDRQPARERATGGEPWQMRVVHLSNCSAGASVWIRDARLAADGEPRLAASLALELAQRGLRLRVLTVNGQKVFETMEAYRHGSD